MTHLVRKHQYNIGKTRVLIKAYKLKTIGQAINAHMHGQPIIAIR